MCVHACVQLCVNVFIRLRSHQARVCVCVCVWLCVPLQPAHLSHRLFVVQAWASKVLANVLKGNHLDAHHEWELEAGLQVLWFTPHVFVYLELCVVLKLRLSCEVLMHTMGGSGEGG